MKVSSKQQGSVVDLLFKILSERWKMVTRGFSACFMISGFSYIIALGPLALVVMVLAVQVKCFQEIMSIGFKKHKIGSSFQLKAIYWYFLVIANYFYYFESFFNYLKTLFDIDDKLNYLISCHRFLSFVLYFIGFILFNNLITKKYVKEQITLVVWTHIAIFVVVPQSFFIIQNMFEGMIWFIVPVMLVNINDIMAYVCGKFFGKTRLIELSPKKTWEGFIGAGFSTLIFGVVFSHVLCQYQFFICPVKYSLKTGIQLQCEPSYLFQIQEYAFGIGSFDVSLSTYPFVLHSLGFSLFSSVIAPFGGFFASGFKRSLKIKDFSNFIPGHGGIMDRFDCMFLMATFVNVYIASYIHPASIQKLMRMVENMNPHQQIEFYDLLVRSKVGEQATF